MIIYKATNIVNGKVYIGQTTRTLKTRIREHSSVSANSHPNKRTYFYRSIQKNGKDAFIWDIIDKASTIHELNEKESFWIKYYRATEKEYGYNNHLGLSGGGHTEETKAKISLAGMRPCSDKTKRKLSIANKGQVPWAKGKTFTKEHCLRISQGQLETRKIDEEIAGKIKDMIHGGEKSVRISEKLSIPVHVVYNIKAGKTWNHVAWPVGYKKKHGIQTTTKEQATMVKQMLCDGARNIDIVKKVGISEHIVSSIRLKKTWRSIPWPTTKEIGKSSRGGTMNINAVIDDNIAAEIKKCIVDGMSQCDMMRKFNVTKSIIYSIKNNKTWRHIPWP